MLKTVPTNTESIAKATMKKDEEDEWESVEEDLPEIRLDELEEEEEKME